MNPRGRHPIIRGARLLAIAIVVGVGVSQVVFTVSDWHLRDMGAYWEAAQRLRDGEPLYPRLSDSEASEVYRYAPWFAWAWVPVTLLPRELVGVLWSGVLLTASAIALWPLARIRAWLLVALFLPILVGISAIGNVQPLLVAALVMGVERRSGPLWIAAAASLKVVPILLIATYIGRRDWPRTGATLLLTVILVGPMLVYDLTHYPASAGAAGALISVPWLYAIGLVGCVAGAVWAARGRHAWLASSVAAAIAVPRLFVYDISLIVVSFARPTLSEPPLTIRQLETPVHHDTAGRSSHSR